MKKKIKDLTLKQVSIICNSYEKCSKCPLLSKSKYLEHSLCTYLCDKAFRDIVNYYNKEIDYE